MDRGLKERSSFPDSYLLKYNMCVDPSVFITYNFEDPTHIIRLTCSMSMYTHTHKSIDFKKYIETSEFRPLN